MKVTFIHASDPSIHSSKRLLRVKSNRKRLKSGDAAGTIMMTRQQENSLEALEALQKMFPFAPFATSDRRGWKGLQAARYRKNVANGEFSASTTRHMLVLTIQPAEKMHLRYEGVKRDIPLPPGSISMVPAGSSVLWHPQGNIDSLFISVEPSQVGRIATESFGFDPTRTVVPPVAGLNLPELRFWMLAVDAELKSGGLGGPLMAESLANIFLKFVKFAYERNNMLLHIFVWKRRQAEAAGGRST
jgi:hypothetical protein